MATERERVRALMVRGEPISAEDVIVARMIITEATRHRRTQVVSLIVGLAALVFAVVYGLGTGRWDWVAVAVVALVTFGAARQVHLQRRAQGWARRYLRTPPGGAEPSAR